MVPRRPIAPTGVRICTFAPFTPSIRPPTYRNAPLTTLIESSPRIDEFVDHDRRIFAEGQLSAVFQRRLEARAFSAVASISEIDFRFNNQRTGLPGLRGLNMRLNLVNGSNGYGLPDGDAGAEDASG